MIADRYETGRERKMDAERLARIDKRRAREVVSAAEYVTHRATMREKILVEYGFDIGTREEANTQTGPYSDPENTMNRDLALIAGGVKIQTFERGLK